MKDFFKVIFLFSLVLVVYAFRDKIIFAIYDRFIYKDEVLSWNDFDNQTEEYPLELDVRGFEEIEAVKHYQMFSEDFDKKSSYEQPWEAPALNKDACINQGIALTKLKPLSWNVIVFELKK